jgi:hypothetical protein
MPSTTEKQRRTMAAALHGADFPLARKLRRSMSTDQLRDFSKSVTKHAVHRTGNRYHA